MFGTVDKDGAACLEPSNLVFWRESEQRSVPQGSAWNETCSSKRYFMTVDRRVIGFQRSR